MKKQLPTPEDVAKTLIQAVCSSFAEVKETQNDLFLALGYSAQDRFDLSVTLAQSFYRTGLGEHYSKQKLRQHLSEGELQAILYELICYATPEQIERQWVTRLLQRPDFLNYARQLRRTTPATTTANSTESQTETGGSAMPSLSQRDREARRGSFGLRSRRYLGRTRRNHDGTVPELLP